MKRALWMLVRAVVAALFLFLAGWALWAGAAWIRYGRPGPSERPDPILSRMLPQPEVMERHERIVRASPSRAREAVRSFRLEDSEVVQTIFRARELAFGLQHESSSSTSPFLIQALAMGWTVLDSIPDREVAYGAVCQPWQGEVHFQGLPPARFITFDQAGYAKIAWAIAVDSLGPDRVRLRTETRVATTDAASREKFRSYWSRFSPGIVLIRFELLRVLAREASRSRVRASATPQGPPSGS